MDVLLLLSVYDDRIFSIFEASNNSYIYIDSFTR